jgi:hypothetical protein
VKTLPACADEKAGGLRALTTHELIDDRRRPAGVNEPRASDKKGNITGLAYWV